MNFFAWVNKDIDSIARTNKQDAAKLVIIACELSTRGYMRVTTTNERAAFLAAHGVGIMPPRKDGTQEGDCYTLYNRRMYAYDRRIGLIPKR